MNFVEKYFDINKDGFSIRCKLYYSKDIRSISHIVISTYGFGGNKDNKATEKFAARIMAKHKSYGVICFDWPCHGTDARNRLILSECIAYLCHVSNYVYDEMNIDMIYNYSSSFGAYVTLCYLHSHARNPFNRIALRCPAIKMYNSITANITDDEWSRLNKGREVPRGFGRSINISKAFLEELKENNISEYDFIEYADDILMIHGTSDDMVPISDTIKFSEDNVIELISVENADHPFSNPPHMDYAIHSIIEFFA